MCVHIIHSSVEPERLSEIEAAIEQAFSAIAKAQREGVCSASSGGDQIDQETRSRLTEALSMSAMDSTITTRQEGT